MFDTVCVVGLGYIGLPTAAVIASRGMRVVGLDVSSKVVDTINQGKIHIVEPELDVVVHSTVIAGTLKATLEPEPADVFVIAVPTPFKEGHKPDLSYIQSAAKAIAPVIKSGDLVILESTSPVGATDQLAEWLNEFRSDLKFARRNGEKPDVHIAHCPERVLPGQVLHELISNDRVIGGMTQECGDLAAKFYKRFVQGDCLLTDARTAELAKLTENTFRDINIAFANELSMICQKLDIDVWELISLANRHPRVNVLQPGPGVGGHCIAVDPWFVVDSAPELARLTRTAREVNDSKPQQVIDRVMSLASQFEEPIIACYGLAFKADIDDLRESPALNICETLAKTLKAKILAVEPNVREVPKRLESLDNVQLANFERAQEEADIHVMLVSHSEFKKPENRKRLYNCRHLIKTVDF